jgi:hypothetical protein
VNYLKITVWSCLIGMYNNLMDIFNYHEGTCNYPGSASLEVETPWKYLQLPWSYLQLFPEGTCNQHAVACNYPVVSAISMQVPQLSCKYRPNLPVVDTCVCPVTGYFLWLLALKQLHHATENSESHFVMALPH